APLARRRGRGRVLPDAAPPVPRRGVPQAHGAHGVTVTVDADVVGAERRADLGLLRVLADAGLLAQRNLRKTSRNFRFMMVATIQPMLQLVLFAFVFGGIVDIPN